jgi:hypothetical protein
MRIDHLLFMRIARPGGPRVANLMGNLRAEPSFFILLDRRRR